MTGPTDIAKIPLAERFWPKVQKGSDCWEWKAGRKGGKFRYGIITIHSKDELAHRVAWKLTNGPIPDGLWVLHKCDNPPCVRPDHLFLGTQEDNNRDAWEKHRDRKSVV